MYEFFQTEYKGYTIVRYRYGNGCYVVYNPLGKNLKNDFLCLFQAEKFIDKELQK